jgi:hypothetical protein
MAATAANASRNTKRPVWVGIDDVEGVIGGLIQADRRGRGQLRCFKAAAAERSRISTLIRLLG